MGSGRYSTDVYNSTVGSTLASGGDTFSYSTAMHSTPTDQQAAHADLEPRDVGVRESRDSDEHPTSVPIAVLFDVTGSMSTGPRILQAELPKLLETLGLGGHVADPQIMFGAIGDAKSDRVPFQIGQFESDNRMDEQLANIFLEGNGGGGNHESYELAFYFMARHTATDAWDKRGLKGHLVIIADERSYPEVSEAEVARVFGDDIPQNIPLEEIIAEVQERWDIVWIMPGTSHYSRSAEQLAYWKNLLGEQNVICLEDLTHSCDEIARRVGATETAKPTP